MSISDAIVVMKDGIVQQIGAPQEVYDHPANLFVAQFLGTPQINTFKGKVVGGKLYIGEESVLDVKCADQDVYVGIRPEGFVPDENGRFTCCLSQVEVMGRDRSVVCTHSASENASVRAIIPSENFIDETKDTIRFNLKPFKVFLFSAQGDKMSLKTESSIHGKQ